MTMTPAKESSTNETPEVPTSARNGSKGPSDRFSKAPLNPKVSVVHSSLGTVRTVVVDASEHLEGNDAIVAMAGDPATKIRVRVKDMIRVFEIEGEHIEVTQEQIDRVRMMHDRFAETIVFCFNYNTLLLVAAVLAGLGLASNSSATIIASMLVSPIMGPVCGMAYGTTIQDWKMVRRSIRTECLSMVFCVVVGALIGLAAGATSLADDWPTDEMVSRGDLQNFLVALPIAFFSGLGVAVSLLDEQTNSLVGVAISASLLPPAVNAGVLWVAYAFVESDNLGTGNDEYDREAFRQGGMYSLCLTLANIILIWISSMFMFRLKEVLPIKKKVFWEDLKIARKIYQKKAFLSNDSCNHLLEDQVASERRLASTPEDEEDMVQ